MSPASAVIKVFGMLSIVGALGLSAVACAAGTGTGLADLSSRDATSAIREALTRSAEAAVGQLGKADGFMGDARVKIPLPESARAAEKMMRTFGMKQQADELIAAMNHAAEMAVVEARPILVSAVRTMSVDDGRAIVAGGDDAATQYFRRTTAEAIGAKFLPIVKASTARVGLAGQYNRYAGQAAKLGLLDQKDADLDRYVTQKAMDGLFLMIAEQEKAIRKDPVGAGSNLLKKVFGAVGQ